MRSGEVSRYFVSSDFAHKCDCFTRPTNVSSIACSNHTGPNYHQLAPCCLLKAEPSKRYCSIERILFLLNVISNTFLERPTPLYPLYNDIGKNNVIAGSLTISRNTLFALWCHFDWTKCIYVFRCCLTIMLMVECYISAEVLYLRLRKIQLQPFTLCLFEYKWWSFRIGICIHAACISHDVYLFNSTRRVDT